MPQIQISDKLAQELLKRKIYPEDKYEEVIWDLIENGLELNEETLKNCEKAKIEIEQGKYYTLKEVKKEFNL